MTGLPGMSVQFGTRGPRPLSWLLLFAVVFSLGLGVPTARAEDEEDEEKEESGSESAWVGAPDWLTVAEMSGRYAGPVSGSESKYLEDHNIQSGPIFKLGIEDEISDDSTLFFEGMVEPVQKQGYMLFDLNQAEGVRFRSDIQAWREYYNTRTGDPDETVLGTQLSPSGIFPNTNRSTHWFGGGKPKADWLRTRTGVAIELPGAFNDAWADFIYRKVDGEMSLLKGGTVFDPTAVPPLVPGSGPGTVFFDVSGRKDVDYESIGAEAGTRSSLGGVNWQFDLRGMSHDLKSKDREPDFLLGFATSQMQTFEEDTTVKNVGGDLVVSRNLRPDIFVFGGTSISWERSDPEPSQIVQNGIRVPSPTRILTRETLSANVVRYSEAVTGGAVFTPTPRVMIRTDAAVRASQSDGRLNEARNESAFLTGDLGVIQNDSDRDLVSARVRVKGDWKVARRFSLDGLAQYDFRYDNVRTTRFFNFVVAEQPEIEDYTTERSQIRAALGGRYRFRRGRTLEGGYDFTWVGFQNDTNTLSNQFLVADYDRYRHRLHVKATGRITRKLRGEIRAQYVFEQRDMDAPETQPPDIAPSDEGKIEYQGFTIAPMLTYQHSPEWSGVLSYSLGRQQYKLVDDGPAPIGFSSTFSDFEYEALTNTLTLGVNWVPSETQSHALSYSMYHNTESVENAGHDASFQSTLAIAENWDVEGALRYLSYLPDDGNNVDDYHAVIVSLGLTGRF
jgi:hypothetical protein